jgi:hypothetical protein
MAAMAVALMVSPVYADVAYQPTLGLVNPAGDAFGNPINDGTYTMVLDLDGDGWNGFPYLSQSPGTPGSFNDANWLWDSDDYLMDIGQISSGLAFPSEYITGNPATVIPGYDAGVDDYYLFWFAKPFSAGAAGPGVDVDYGAELLGKAGPDGFSLTPDAIGGAATFKTLGTHVVPEPVSCVLAVIGGGAMALRRRFGAVNA